MAKLTKGSQLYFVDPTGNTVTEITKITNLNPGGSPADQIEITTLTSEAKEFMRGMRTPGTASLEVDADPENSSHVRIHQLAQDDTIDSIPFAIGWSDGNSTPSVDSNGDFDVSGATDRSWTLFDAYVADFPFDFSTNNVVKSSISLQRTGQTTWQEKV